ncbi:MAG: hypothetical protein WCJ64_20435 [Rhodospirillaceae bacterium]
MPTPTLHTNAALTASEVELPRLLTIFAGTADKSAKPQFDNALSVQWRAILDSLKRFADILRDALHSGFCALDSEKTSVQRVTGLLAVA